MNKLYKIFILFILCSLPVFSQNVQNDTVDSPKEFRPSEMYLFYNDRYTGYMKFEYNDRGQLIKLSIYDVNKKSIGSSVISYNQEGFIVREDDYDPQEKCQNYSLSIYKKDKLTRDEKFSCENVMIEYKDFFYEGGRIRTVKGYNEKNELKEVVTYEYREGKTSKLYYHDGKNIKIKEVEYHYAESGNLARLNINDLKKNFMLKSVMHYEEGHITPQALQYFVK